MRRKTLTKDELVRLHNDLLHMFNAKLIDPDEFIKMHKLVHKLLENIMKGE